METPEPGRVRSWNITERSEGYERGGTRDDVLTKVQACRSSLDEVLEEWARYEAPTKASERSEGCGQGLNSVETVALPRRSV